MIITLNQTQIEEAITDYVNARLVVAEGHRLDIDLRATRGDNGFTATIEINRADAPVQAAAPAAAPAARSVAEVLDAEDEAQVAEEPAAPTPKATIFKPKKVKAEAAPVEATEAPEAAPEAEEAPAEPKRPSIFSNMVKPTGRVGDGDNSEAA
jgi:hypothetical protein